jgi:hypothetical protein
MEQALKRTESAQHNGRTTAQKMFTSMRAYIERNNR